jgi:2,3-bisphosphoglycerate-independent phosphoglycerate mutase
MKKILLIILGGAADLGEKTPFQIANIPNIDSLAKQGICGMINIGYGKRIDSDVGVLTLLGVYSKEGYPGRAYLEALGIGLKPELNDVCVLGNFATLDNEGNILNRGVRKEEGLEELAEKLDGMEIDGILFEVRKSFGPRVVIVLKGEKISPDVMPNDPEKTGVPLPQVKPTKFEGKFTASVLNKFIFRTRKILSQYPINKERKNLANIILINNIGRKKETISFEERFGLSASCISGTPTIKGVACFLGMDVITVPKANGKPDTNLKGKFREVFEKLKSYDFVILHINGADVLSHEGKREEKTKFIESVDKELGKVLESINSKETIIVITSDHRTDSSPDSKGYRHDPSPVPVLISGNEIAPDRIEKFDENSCLKGRLYIQGNGLIPLVLKLI